MIRVKENRVMGAFILINIPLANANPFALHSFFIKWSLLCLF